LIPWRIGKAFRLSRHGETGLDVKAGAVSGVRWSSFSTIALIVANVAYTAIASRLVSPSAFGLMALANLVVLFLGFFTRLGLASALVQKPDLNEEDIRAASTVGAVLGMALFALVWPLTPWICEIFHEPALSGVLRVLAISLPITGWSMTGLGLLTRDLRFGELSVVTVTTYIFCYVVVGIALALAGAGVWSLVGASLTSAIMQAAWQYTLVRHPVRPPLRWTPYRTVGGFGATLTLAHWLDYVGNNLCTFVIGRSASTAVVGQFNRAYYLAFQSIRIYLGEALANVLFSSLSAIQGDKPRVRRVYLSVLCLGALALFPPCVGMAVAAPELVRVVLGPSWQLAASILPWFALAAAMSVLSRFSQALAESRAALGRSLLVQGVYIVILSLLLLLVAYDLQARGLWLFAAAVAIGEFCRFGAYLHLTRRLLRFGMVEVIRSLLPGLFAAAVVGLALGLVRITLSSEISSSFALLTAEFLVGILAYAIGVRVSPLPNARRELWSTASAFGVLGRVGRWRWRLALLVLGAPREGPTDTESPPPQYSR
jgi:O-antigen/teichoic acid export membrane protein